MRTVFEGALRPRHAKALGEEAAELLAAHCDGLRRQSRRLQKVLKPKVMLVAHHGQGVFEQDELLLNHCYTRPFIQNSQ